MKTKPTGDSVKPRRKITWARPIVASVSFPTEKDRQAAIDKAAEFYGPRGFSRFAREAIEALYAAKLAEITPSSKPEPIYYGRTPCYP